MVDSDYEKELLIIVIVLQFGWTKDFIVYCFEMEQKYYRQKMEEVESLMLKYLKYPNIASDLTFVLYHTQGFVFGYCLGGGKVLSYGEFKDAADTLFNVRLETRLKHKQGQQ